MVKSECIYNSKNFSGMMKYPFRVVFFLKKEVLLYSCLIQWDHLNKLLDNGLFRVLQTCFCSPNAEKILLRDKN